MLNGSNPEISLAADRLDDAIRTVHKSVAWDLYGSGAPKVMAKTDPSRLCKLYAYLCRRTFKSKPLTELRHEELA